MRDVPLKTFYRSYIKSLNSRNAALFVGAGLSKPAGLSDWKELLRHIAEDLGLDIDKEANLVELAQFHVNNRGSDRSYLNQILIDEFTRDVKLTENHRLVANLPLETVWTTNYDGLLEEAYREAHKRPDVKYMKEQLANTMPRRDVVIYKMHGDISLPNEAVLIKDDYEIYNEKRQLFSLALQGDLVSKTFLFLGFSFTDPNID